MTKTTKIIAALGVVAGLGVAALPLASNAAESADVTLTVTVGKAIELTVDSATKAVSINPGATDNSLSTTATVTTNDSDGYLVYLADADNDTNLVSGTNYIPAFTAGQATLSAAASGWGVKLPGASEYVGVPAADATHATSLVVANEATVADAEDYVVEYGIAIAGDQASGVYTDTVTFTAVAK